MRRSGGQSPAEAFGERGIVRGNICGFDIYGQAGCWQDACCLVGTEQMILATYDDPAWVHELLGILFRRKQVFVRVARGRALRRNRTRRGRRALPR